MANALYGLGRNKFARGDINWLASGGDTIRVCLVKTAYGVQIDTHEFFSSLGANVVGNAGGATRADCPALTLSDPALGVCDAANVTITAVPGSVGQLSFLVLFKDSGVDGTSPLLYYMDTVTGLPFTPGGGDVSITWDDGTNKIFKL